MQPVRHLTRSACLSASLAVSLLAAGAAHAQINPEVTIAAGADWNGMKGPLRDAIECKAPLKATATLRKALHAKDSLTGDYKLPEPLTVFGGIKVTALSIYDGGEEGASYTVKPAGLKLAEIAKAARLKKDADRYIRSVKGGHVEAGEPVKGQPQVACIFGESADD